MRILYLKTKIGSGGLERIITDKINYLIKNNNYEIAYAYFGSGNEVPPYDLDSKVQFFPMKIKTCGNFRTKFKSVLKVYQKLNSIIKEFKPDIIENADCVVATWILPFIHRKISKILEIHQSYYGLMQSDSYIYKGNKFKIWVNKKLRTFVYPLYHHVIVLTDADKKLWGFKNIKVIGNFSTLRPKQQRIIGETNLSRIAISAGRLSYQKNYDLLIKSWSFVLSKHPDWKLQIWGDGELHSELQTLINKLSLNNTVQLCGETSNISSVYENADFFILPSMSEGFPLVISEAMQFGLPCVAFSLDAVTNRIIHEKTGFLADNQKRSPEELAKAICKCIENIEVSDHLSRKAYQTIQCYNIDNIMKCWIDLFESCIKTKHQN